MAFDPFKKFEFTFDSEGYFQSCLIPKKLETCPCCGAQLTANAEGWTEEIIIPPNSWKIRIMFPDEIKIDCIRDMECFEENENSQVWRMPYVYWLPVETHCASWVTRMLRIYYHMDPVPKRWLTLNGQLNLFEGPKTVSEHQAYLEKTGK